MTWIDTHCHLDQPALFEKIERVIKNSIKSDIEGIVVPSVSPENVNEVINISQRFDLCSLALGFHPFFSDRVKDEDLKILSLLLIEHDAVAVGEIGLDFYVSSHDKLTQIALFEKQLKVAATFNLPIILHVRKAHDQVILLLRKYSIKGGIVHCFNGSEQQAKDYIKLGVLLGVGGAVSYSRATRLRNMFAKLPLSALVLETDAPDMPLQDQEGKRNSPEFIPHILDILVSLRPESASAIAQTTTANVRALLSI